MHYAQMYCIRCKKTVLKGYLLYNFIYMTFQKGEIIRTENSSVVPKNRGWREGVTTKGHEGMWQVMGLFCTLITVVVTRLYVYVKT